MVNARRLAGPLAGLGVALVVGAILYLTRPAEPLHQGRPVSYWLDRLVEGRDHYVVQQALETLGPQAVPAVVRRIAADHRWYVSTLDAWRFRLSKAISRKALPVGRLDGLYRSMAKQWLGKEAMPALAAYDRHPNPVVRLTALEALGGFARPELIPYLPKLSRALGDRYEGVRYRAALLVKDIGPPASDLVPALTAILTEASDGRRVPFRVNLVEAATDALGAIGPAARSALPPLTSLAAGTNSLLRVRAAVASWRIGRRDADVFAVLLTELERNNVPPFSDAIEVLGEMGPQAKPALPHLARLLPMVPLGNAGALGNPHARLTNVMFAIDPVEAARWIEAVPSSRFLLRSGPPVPSILRGDAGAPSGPPPRPTNAPPPPGPPIDK